MPPARFAARYPRLVIALFVLSSLAVVPGLLRLRQNDDLLAFIPPNNPDARAFHDVNKAFGATRVALVGVEAPAGEDLFTTATMKRLDVLTRALKSVRGVDSVDALHTVDDFVATEAGVETSELVRGAPATAEELKALREKVMSRPHVVGNFISADARAALFMVFLADGAADREVARELRKAVESERGPLRVFYGGMPFAAAAIFEETQADIQRLTPFAALLILLV